MNVDRLQELWAKQTFAPPSGSTDHLRKQLVDEVRRRHRSFRRVIGVAAFACIVGWIVLLVTHLTGIKPLNAVTLGTTLVSTAIELACLGFALRSLRRLRFEAEQMGASLHESVGSSLRIVEWQIADCQRANLVLIVVFGLSVAIVSIKVFTGNLPMIGAACSIVASVVLGGAVLLTLRRYCRRDLLPRREALLQQRAALEENR